MRLTSASSTASSRRLPRAIPPAPGIGSAPERDRGRSATCVPSLDAERAPSRAPPGEGVFCAWAGPGRPSLGLLIIRGQAALGRGVAGVGALCEGRGPAGLPCPHSDAGPRHATVVWRLIGSPTSQCLAARSPARQGLRKDPDWGGPSLGAFGGDRASRGSNAVTSPTGWRAVKTLKGIPAASGSAVSEDVGSPSPSAPQAREASLRADGHRKRSPADGPAGVQAQVAPKRMGADPQGQ